MKYYYERESQHGAKKEIIIINTYEKLSIFIRRTTYTLCFALLISEPYFEFFNFINLASQNEST